jgi:hypothetical protein
MIFTAIATIWLTIFRILMESLATLDISGNQIGASITLATTYIFKANYFFPFFTVFEIMILVFSVEAPILSLKVFNWFFDKIRGAG